MIKLYENRTPGTEVEQAGLLDKKVSSTVIELFKLLVWSIWSHPYLSCFSSENGYTKILNLYYNLFVLTLNL